jgi:Leucine-rich repeat (LRR) protein
VVAALRAGAYEDPPDATVLVTDPIGRSASAPYSEICIIEDRRVAELVAELDDPLAIQQLYLNKAAVADLAGLAPLHNLREVSVNQATTAIAALPHHLPVEALAIDAANADISLLNHHPTLWHLTLKGIGGTVSIEPLASLPALAYLDLSGVTVPDLERVATLPALRVLVLNGRQWRHLREHGAVPTALAGARMAELTSLSDAIDSATWLRGGTSQPSSPPIYGTC